MNTLPYFGVRLRLSAITLPYFRPFLVLVEPVHWALAQMYIHIYTPQVLYRVHCSTQKLEEERDFFDCPSRLWLTASGVRLKIHLYIYMHIYIHNTYTYICMYMYMYIYICVFIYIYICVYIYIYVCMYTYINIHMYIKIHIYKYIYRYMHVYIHRYIYI